MTARGKISKKKWTSKSARSGLVFPVGRILRYFKTMNAKTSPFRISIGSAVYGAAVLEYLVAEIMELAAGAARTMKRKIITPRHVMLAIEGDSEMKQVISDVIIPSCGRPLQYQSDLLRKSGKSPAKTGSNKSPVAPAKIKLPVKNLPFKGKTQQNDQSNKNTIKVLGKPVANPKEIRILHEKTLSLGQKLTVVQGDITLLPGEAIVHPTGSSFQFHGEVGERIASVGGQEQKTVVDLLRANRPSIKTSEAVICEAKNIPYSHIIHVNSPTWSGSDTSSAVTALEEATTNILKLADTMNLASISIPSIGSGRAGYPKQIAAQTILRTIKEYFATAMQSSIRQVYFVLYDLESVNVYTSELGRLD